MIDIYGVAPGQEYDPTIELEYDDSEDEDTVKRVAVKVEGEAQ
jgi:hypothetical protein